MRKKIRKIVSILISFNAAWFKALINGVAPAIEHLQLLKGLEYKTLVDIGANKGQFALAARYCHKNANIISFEPLDRAVQKYKKIFENDNYVNIHNIAIGNERGKISIHVSKKDDSSSLLPITNKQTSIFPGTQEDHKETVIVNQLADVISIDEIQKPALLKIDVQGYEKETLLGCQNLLKIFTYIYVECSFYELYKGQSMADEIIAYLRQEGFRLIGIYNMEYDNKGIAIQGDFLFMNQLQ